MEAGVAAVFGVTACVMMLLALLGSDYDLCSCSGYVAMDPASSVTHIWCCLAVL